MESKVAPISVGISGEQIEDFSEELSISGKVDFLSQLTNSRKESPSQQAPCHPPSHCLVGSSIGVCVLRWSGGLTEFGSVQVSSPKSHM